MAQKKHVEPSTFIISKNLESQDTLVNKEPVIIVNAVKHGESQVTEHCWNSLADYIDNDELLMKEINGKLATSSNLNLGIEIANVRKRLELL